VISNIRLNFISEILVETQFLLLKTVAFLLKKG